MSCCIAPLGDATSTESCAGATTVVSTTRSLNNSAARSFDLLASQVPLDQKPCAAVVKATGQPKFGGVLRKALGRAIRLTWRRMYVNFPQHRVVALPP